MKTQILRPSLFPLIMTILFVIIAFISEHYIDAAVGSFIIMSVIYICDRPESTEQTYTFEDHDIW